MSAFSPLKEFGLLCAKARLASGLSLDRAADRINNLAINRDSIADKKTIERTEKGFNWPKFALVIAMAEIYQAPHLLNKRAEYERMDFLKGKEKLPMRQHRQSMN